MPRFLETRKLGLAGPPCLQVNQLGSGGGRYWFSFLSLPPYSLPTPTFTHFSWLSARPAKVTWPPSPEHGLPASSARRSPGHRAASDWLKRPRSISLKGFASASFRPLKAFWITKAGLTRKSGPEMARISQKEGGLKKDREEFRVQPQNSASKG